MHPEGTREPSAGGPAEGRGGRERRRPLAAVAIGMAIGVLALFLGGRVAAQAKGDAGKGRNLYVEKCVLCHGSQGEGWDWSKKVAKPPVPVPDLAKVVPGRSDKFLFDVIKGGGEAVGKTRFMPPFEFQLSEQQVWDLVAYMRSISPVKK